MSILKKFPFVLHFIEAVITLFTLGKMAATLVYRSPASEKRPGIRDKTNVWVQLGKSRYRKVF